MSAGEIAHRKNSEEIEALWIKLVLARDAEMDVDTSKALDARTELQKLMLRYAEPGRTAKR